MSWYRLNKAAKYTDVSPRTIKRWFSQGLRHSRHNGTPYIKTEWIDEFLEGREVNDNLVDQKVKEILKDFGENSRKRYNF